jgi:ketosteroid isomerase-like protein
MSRENVEVVHRLVGAWNGGNLEAILAAFEPECEVVFPHDVPEPGPFHGHAELRQWAEGFLAAWDFHHSEVVEVVDAGDTVVAVLHLVGRGIGSGVEMDETDAHVFTIREGKIARWQNFNERGDALEAAGLKSS